MKITRRKVLELAAALPATSGATAKATQGMSPAAADPGNSVQLGWLGGAAPTTPTGISWGVPWPKGAVKKEETFVLHDAGGQTLPLQSWPLAWWGDGSVKWSAFSTAVAANVAGPLRLAPGRAGAPTPSVTVKTTTDGVEVRTGKLWCHIPMDGRNIIETLSITSGDQRVVARQGHLVCALEDRARWDSEGITRIERFSSTVKRVTVEQSGPVRATVRIEGIHKADSGPREWLPFTVRLYFYAGQEAIRLVHTIIFDGDEQKDFIRALGVAFTVPMREQVVNRHVRFSGDELSGKSSGLWSEPVQPLTGRRVLQFPGRDIYRDQLAGKAVPNKEQYSQQGQATRFKNARFRKAHGSM